MRKSGHADLPLHGGRVPRWLSQRMSKLGGSIVESIVLHYGREEVVRRLSDPLWFQSLGSVLGMDWHSSGITTSVMGALKASVNPRSQELGIYICGGRGRHSRKTPSELLQIADQTGLDGDALVRSSKLSAKVDNTAIQDGFQLYLHSFILTREGTWAVVQQGMNGSSGMARRYHWHSGHVSAFTEEPHTAVCGQNQGQILNLTHREARITRRSILDLTVERPIQLISEIKKIVMPGHHEVRVDNVNLKRLGAVLTLAHEREIADFDDFLITKGLGPRTLQALTLVSEVIHGTPSRFADPARFSFAHGGKDGHPFPVPTRVYDETIEFLNDSVVKAKMAQSEKQQTLKRLHSLAKKLEDAFQPDPAKFDAVIEREWKSTARHGGRTARKDYRGNSQLDLFGNIGDPG